MKLCKRTLRDFEAVKTIQKVSDSWRHRARRDYEIWQELVVLTLFCGNAERKASLGEGLNFSSIVGVKGIDFWDCWEMLERVCQKFGCTGSMEGDRLVAHGHFCVIDRKLELGLVDLDLLLAITGDAAAWLQDHGASIVRRKVGLRSWLKTSGGPTPVALDHVFVREPHSGLRLGDLAMSLVVH